MGALGWLEPPAPPVPPPMIAIACVRTPAFSTFDVQGGESLISAP